MDTEKFPGPYRATKLWNEAICLFRNGMPLKRHRKHIKLYDNCFSGGEAVTWLHRTLKDNENFGQDVTRDKTFQLLSKFFKVGIFQSVGSGSSDCLDSFKENELYRFCCRSPLRTIKISDLASLSNQNLQRGKGVTRSLSKCSISQRFPKRSPSFQSNYLEEIKSRAASNQLKQMEMEEVWKTVVFGRLQALLSAVSVEDLLPSNQTSGAWIMRNANTANGQTSYHSFNRSQLFPRWILAAMKSLIDWPHLSGSASYSIWYPGFEVDVFRVIKDYFSNLELPLIPSFLYSAFINAYAYIEYVESLQEYGGCDSAEVDFQSLQCGLPSKSQENLVLDMSATSDMRENVIQLEPVYCPLQVRENVSSFHESFSDNCGGSSKGSSNKTHASHYPMTPEKNEISVCVSDSQFFRADKLLSSTLPPNACFETAFTSDSPVTRIIPRKLVENIHLTHKNRQRASICQNSLCCASNSSHEQTNNHTPSLPNYVQCNIRRNSSAPNLIDVNSVTSDEQSNNAGMIEVVHNTLNYKCEVKPKVQNLSNTMRLKSHPKYSPFDCSQGKLNTSQDAGERQSVGRRKFPSESGLNEKLHHIRNKSGGYVNVALSNSLDELDKPHGFDHLLGEVLDYDRALETLHKLIKCTYKDRVSECFSENKISDEYGNHSCSSSSSIWSYHTAASGEQSCSSRTPAANSQFELDYSYRNQISEELMNSGVQTVQGQQLGLEILQLLLLLLPPVNRYKLHLLLYFMSNIINNGRFILKDGVSTKSLLLDTFTPSVLQPETNVKGDEGLARRLVSFFLDHHQTLFQVPSGLQVEVNSHLQYPKKAEFSVSSRVPMTYCEQISCQQFEEQKLTESQLALTELLDQIIMDEKMGTREKKKRLKMFKESYPHIYCMRFPCYKKEDGKQPKSKGLLGFASFARLRNIRL